MRRSDLIEVAARSFSASKDVGKLVGESNDMHSYNKLVSPSYILGRLHVSHSGHKTGTPYPSSNPVGIPRPPLDFVQRGCIWCKVYDLLYSSVKLEDLRFIFSFFLDNIDSTWIDTAFYSYHLFFFDVVDSCPLLSLWPISSCGGVVSCGTSV